MMAVAALDPAISMICYLIALVLFVLAFIAMPVRWNLVAGGLAFWVFVLFWDSLARL